MRSLSVSLMVGWTLAHVCGMAHAESFAEARATGRPYSCEYDSPAFFGERTYLRARVIGTDYVVEFSETEEHPSDDEGMYRIGKWGYYWIDDGQEVHASKLDLERVEALHQSLFERPFYFSIISMDAPDDDAVCEPTEPFSINLPKHDYKDATQGWIEQIHTWYREQLKILDDLPFEKLSPQPRPSGFDRTRGSASPRGYTLDYVTSWEKGGTTLRLRFLARATAEKRDLCWEQPGCAEICTTPEGRRIFAHRRWMGPYREPLVGHEYSVDIDGAVVIITWTDWTTESGRPDHSHHEFAPNQLEALVDSLQSIGSVELLRYPEMSISPN